LTVALVELLDTAFGGRGALVAGEERMALGAHVNSQILLNRTGNEAATATAGHSRLAILRMNFLFHVSAPRFTALAVTLNYYSIRQAAAQTFLEKMFV
jgi:hypothetical protein